MHVVVDACTAINIVRKGPGAESDLRALESFEEVIAPELYLTETANALKKYVFGGFITKEKSFDLLRGARDLISTFYPVGEDYVEPLSESLRLKHSPYDMLYLILARRKGAALFTRDEKLFQLAAREGVPVIIEF